MSKPSVLYNLLRIPLILLCSFLFTIITGVALVFGTYLTMEYFGIRHYWWNTTPFFVLVLFLLQWWILRKIKQASPLILVLVFLLTAAILFGALYQAPGVRC